MFKVLVPAVAALGLVAFTAQPNTSIAHSDPLPDAAASTMAWSVHHEGALAKLAYGVANSDQLALMVTCMPGQRTAAVYGDVLIEGEQLTNASLVVDPLSGGDAEEMTIAVRSPALERLAGRGEMTVVGENGRYEIPASVKERRLVRDFLSYCAADRA